MSDSINVENQENVETWNGEYFRDVIFPLIDKLMKNDFVGKSEKSCLVYHCCPGGVQKVKIGDHAIVQT